MKRNRRRAFTILEVLLTLLIAGLLIAAIGSAMHIHLRVVDAGRAEVEQAQLARALLRAIADDLRGIVPIAESGDAATVDATESTAAAVSTSSATEAAAAAAKTKPTSEVDATKQPQFVGTQYELQFDAGRLPNVAQFAGVSSDAAMSGSLQPADALSDVRTVSYSVGAMTQTTGDPFAVPDPGVTPINGGLIRRELSRAASAFAYTQGGGAIPQERLLANEVVAVQFGYYDGSQWLTEWDTSITPALPLCVEVLLSLRSTDPGAPVDSLTLLAAPNQTLEKTYRLVVHLSASGATSADSQSASTDSTATEATP